jgi:F-type H+-transporting ATPase subunit epsilon
VVLSDDVDMINAPTKDGRVGILPRHAPLLTILEAGELDIIKGGVRTPFAVSGGFMEVLPTRVTILADTVERADEIDETRAEQARQLAAERKQMAQSEREAQLAELQLRKEMARLQVARLKDIRRGQ